MGKQKAQRRHRVKKHLIFISHAATDTWIAQRIAERIEACGAETFLDEAHISAGEDFEEKIREALARANELLVLFTPWSLKRPFVWAEIGVAWSRQIPIVSVLHGQPFDEFLAKVEIPVFIKKRDLIDLNHLDDYLAQLRKRIGSFSKK